MCRVPLLAANLNHVRSQLVDGQRQQAGCREEREGHDHEGVDTLADDMRNVHFLFPPNPSHAKNNASKSIAKIYKKVNISLCILTFLFYLVIL